LTASARLTPEVDRSGRCIVTSPSAEGCAVRFFAFHLMPYTQLSADYDGPAWVTCPNELYDPELGRNLYNTYLDQLLYAEELGFDGVSTTRTPTATCRRPTSSPRSSPARRVA
jgi:hypothetical protein